MAKETIWRPETYRALFQLLTDQFGPHATWEQNNRPGNGRNAEFVQFCATFAELYGMKSGLAVEHAILWGIGPKAGSAWTLAGNSRRIMASMTYAFEAGFIPAGYFPDALVDGKRTTKAKPTVLRLVS